MCFEALIDSDATDRPLRELIREEMGSAVKDAGIATVTVAIMLVAVGGISASVVAGAGIVAFAFGLVLHQVVFVAGVGIVRWRASPAERPAQDPVSS